MQNGARKFNSQRHPCIVGHLAMHHREACITEEVQHTD